MRTIGAEVHTVGALQEALAATDPSTQIHWSTTDYEGDPVPAVAEIDATALTVTILVQEA